MTAGSYRNVGNRKRLVDRVVTEIQREIMDGTLTPGMMLPPERELTEQLGVSRTALREAVRMLVTKGLLETRPGVGTIIKRVTSTQITEPLSLFMNQSGGIDLDHLDQVRNILEVEVASYAAMQATPSDIKNLELALIELGKARNDVSLFNQCDGEFHMAIANATHNPLMAVLLNSVHDLTNSVRERLRFQYPQMCEEVYPDHEKIFNKIKAKDPEGARNEMANHLHNARQIQKRFLHGLK